MLRWIVSLTALIAVSSVFAQGSSFCNNGDNNKDKNSFCDPTPSKPNDNGYCNPKPPCDPKPPTNCVPEPTSVAALAIGGIGFLLRKKKKA
jgi:hypothetical protein